LTLSLVTFTNANSQSIALGIEGGINISNINVTPTVTTDSRTGILVGGIIDINITKTITITSGLRYIMKGWSNTGEGVTYTDKLGYIEFPALLKVKFPLTEVKPYLIAGPTLGIKVSANESATNGTQTQDNDISSLVESTDFGLLFGAGIDFSVGNKTSLFIQPAYSLGLSNILKNSTTTTIKNYSIEITAGVKFSL
jgi:hypothetical protein